MKKLNWVLLGVLGLALSGQVAVADGSVKGSTYIPQGNPVNGRKVFIQLNCIACHNVQGDTFPKAPWSAARGPLLRDPQNKRSAGYILDSILLPSHRIAGKDLPAGQASPMGSYFPHAMTGGDLLDIAAYLNSDPALAESRS